MGLVRVRVLIEGKVQGVFFRAYSLQKAKSLGVKGYVKNSPDGKVDIIAEGEGKNIEDFVEWCHKGPLHARVTKVLINHEQYKGEYEKFSIVY